MAENLFEKYGIKEVADVTLYRIERKDETYESQRKISISSILKGALTKETVYPIDEDGKGEADGYEAYVFKDADVLTHFNYDCDDVISAKGNALFVDVDNIAGIEVGSLTDGTVITGDALANIQNWLIADSDDLTDGVQPNLFYSNNVTIMSLIDEASNRNIRDKYAELIARGYVIEPITVSNLGNVIYNGTSKTANGGDNLEEIKTFRCDLIAPIDLNQITIQEFEEAIEGKGEITYEGTTVTSGYITYTVPANATPEEIIGAFQMEQRGLYEHLGVIIRFTQPYEVSSELGIRFEGEIGIGLHNSQYNDAFVLRYDEDTVYTGAVARVLKKVKNANVSNLTSDEVITLIDNARVIQEGGNISVANYKAAPSTYTIENVFGIEYGAPFSITYSYTLENAPVSTGNVVYNFANGLEGDYLQRVVRSAANVHHTEFDESFQALDEECEDITASWGDWPGPGEENVTAVNGMTLHVSVNDSADVDLGFNKFSIAFNIVMKNSDETETGTFDLSEGSAIGHYHMDTDLEVGTHEFSYPEQVCMLFAKNQNLITKAGTRYAFANPNQLFGNIEFDDNFVTAPNGRERVVVVGLSGRISENLYDIDEVNEAIKELTDTLEAKAYDITYSDYAELLVEDEMGYYLPQQLGGFYNKKTQAVTFFDQTNTYHDYAASKKGIDINILNAINTWGDDTHYSINDAIDALKQESKLIDGASEFNQSGFTRVFGGYKVTGGVSQSELPLDDIGRGLQYEDYTINGVTINDTFGNKLSSPYSLDGVLQALTMADLNGQVGQIRITSTAQMESNRAIYVDPDNGLLANRAAIYLLKNVNGKAIGADKNGIFEFYDKKGNRLYYQDKVFAGTAYLALIVIGSYGLIFVVNRHCTKNFTQTAWMINDNGYITDKQAERIVKNGLIHTVSVTACDETFDATCTVGSIKIRKTVKNVLRYVPVLFLDSLKVSTIEGAATSTDATGGRGNAKLITWDYGKEITLTIQDALYTPASMSAIWAGTKGDLKNGVKDTHIVDRMEKITAKRSFIIPAGNQEGVASEGNTSAQAVYIDPKTMDAFQDGTPIAEGEVLYKWTRSVAYEGNSIGNTIEISADAFPGTYRVVGETMVRDKATGEDQRFQFIIPEAKMSAETTTITLQADGDPAVFDFTMKVLRPDNGIMMKFVQFDVEENTEENDGSTMVKNTENLNLLDDAEMYKISGGEEEELIIGATEY